MKTGMIIIHYNDFESLKNVINNVKDYKILDKVIIFDNNSNKKTIEKIKTLTNKKIELVTSKENKGYSYAINEGSKYLIKTLGPCNIIISNSDIIIEKETDIVELVKLLDTKTVGLVAPTVIERDSLNRGWKNPSPLIDSLMNLPYIHRFIRKKYVFYNNDYYNNDYSLVDVASGCFFLIKSKTFESINFLDENVFLYYEENILAKKLHIKKMGVLLSNKIKIVHNHSISIDKNMNKINKLKMQKKSQYYFQSNYNDANLLQRALLRLTRFIVISLLTVLYFLKDKFKN